MARELWEVYVSGRVQGVGYRYFTREASLGFDISGYSRNMPDGSVKLEIEGETDELRSFTEILRNGPGRVKDVVITKKKFVGTFSGFSIRH